MNVVKRRLWWCVQFEFLRALCGLSWRPLRLKSFDFPTGEELLTAKFAEDSREVRKEGTSARKVSQSGG
jgi:hypothetical protein